MFPESQHYCFILYDNGCNTVNTSPELVVGISTLVQAIAFTTTFIRYWDMRKYDRLHLDDHVCLSALCFSAVPYILLVAYVMGESVLLKTIPSTVFTRLGWLGFYTAALWGGRVAVALSIARFFSPFSRIATSAACIFGAIGAGLILHKVLVCGTKYDEVLSCPISSHVGYVEASFDVIGDAWLIGAPLFLVHRTRLAQQHRLLLTGIFSCAIFTSIASVIHAVYVVRKEVVLIMFTGIIQSTLSIVNSNMLVLVAYVYRNAISKSRNNQDTTADPDVPSNGIYTPVLQVTTRDLPHPGPLLSNDDDGRSSETFNLSFTDLYDMEYDYVPDQSVLEVNDSEWSRRS